MQKYKQGRSERSNSNFVDLDTKVVSDKSVELTSMNPEKIAKPKPIIIIPLRIHVVKFSQKVYLIHPQLQDLRTVNLEISCAWSRALDLIYAAPLL